MTNEEIFETLSNVYMTPQEHRAWIELYTKVAKYENDKDAPYKENMKYYEVEDWANDNGYIVVPLKMFDKMMNAYKAMQKIRADIKELDNADHDFEGYFQAINEFLEIINKHIGEEE